MERKQRTAAYLLILPFCVLFVFVLILPLLYAGYLSTMREQLVGGASFVGFDNYLRALTDAKFWAGIGRTFLVFIIQVPIMLGLSLLFALALDSGRLRFPRLARIGIFLPYAVPGVVAVLMWGYLYGRDFGPISQLLRTIGVDADLLAPGNALGAIMNIITWSFVGYNMIIIYAALRSIPAELYDAAEVDGAGPWQVAWSIKIPSVRPALLLTAIFSTIGSFQLFTEPQLLRVIAPQSIDSAYTPNLYAYTLAFSSSEVNYAAAISFLLGFIIMVISYIVQLTSQRRGLR